MTPTVRAWLQTIAFVLATLALVYVMVSCDALCRLMLGGIR